MIPGQFGRRGHDYREDIARFVSAVYDLPVTPTQLLAIEHALRDRELQWAQKRVVTEQLARAREAVTREVKSWGVSSGGLTAADIQQLIGGAPADAITKEVVDTAPQV